MTKLQRMYYDVLVLPLTEDGKPDEAADPVEYLNLELRYGDMTRGELEANKRRMLDASKAPIGNSSCWVWASLVRNGHITDGYQSFHDRLLSLKPVKDESTGKAKTEEVPPTKGRSRSRSSSPPTTGRSSTGSTPTSTTS